MATTILQTIQQQINYGKALKISNASFYLKDKLTIADSDNIKINFEYLLSNYRSAIEQYIKEYTLDDEQKQDYFYQPKKLSNDLYGTIELAPLIMRINHIPSVIEFNKPRLKLFTPAIIDFLNEVLIKEKTRISQNNKDMKS